LIEVSRPGGAVELVGQSASPYIRLVDDLFADLG